MFLEFPAGGSQIEMNDDPVAHDPEEICPFLLLNNSGLKLKKEI
jgi:hypothetical protein